MRKRTIAMLVVFVVAVLFLSYWKDAMGQTTGVDRTVPNHFRFESLFVPVGETRYLRVLFEGYQAPQEIQILFDMRGVTNFELIGALPGPDIGHCFSGTLQFRRNYNNHPGIYKINLSNWCSYPCDAEIYGSLELYRLLGIRKEFHILDIAIRGLESGTAELPIVRHLGGFGCYCDAERSFMSFYVENSCPTDDSWWISTYLGYLRDPAAYPDAVVTASVEPFVLDAPSINPTIKVDSPTDVGDCDDDDDDCTAITASTWARVKGLYR